MAQNASLTIRLPEDLKAELQEVADGTGEKLTPIVILAIRDGLEAARKKGVLGDKLILKPTAAHSKAQADSQPAATVPRVRRTG